MISPSQARRVPWFLVAALTAKACWVLWLGYHGMPHITSDGPCFKQPAYMRLFTPNFSIPSYAGTGPYYELFNSYPSTGYTYANYLVFKLFGFSQFTSIGFDLAVHFIISAVGAVALWRITGGQLAALVFLLFSSQWLLPFGRPEEFGILLILAGLLTLPLGRLGFVTTILAVGLAGASTPGAAIVGTALLVSFEALQRGISNNWLRLLSLLLVPALVSAALYVAYIFPYLLEAIEQDKQLRASDFYYRISLTQLFNEHTAWAATTFGLLGGAVAIAAIGFLKPPSWFPAPSKGGDFLRAAGIAILVGVALNLVMQRPIYDYRHVIVLSVAAMAVVAGSLQSAGDGKRYAGLAVAGLALALSLPGQVMILRQSLGILTWSADDFDFNEAKALVNRVVPKHATVGGDGSSWAMIDDGRPFLIVRTLAPEHWPEYVVSTNWAKPPAAAQRAQNAKILAEHYDELVLTPSLPSNGCGLNVGGYKVQLARGRCDWYPTIWKRRSVPPLKTPVDEN